MIKLFRLFKTLSLSHIKNDKFKSFLALFGMTLGIAVFVSIHLANQNAFESFSYSTQKLAGRSGLTVHGTSAGIPEKLIAQIKNMVSVDTVSPRSSQFVQAFSKGNRLGMVQVVGVDLVNNPTLQYWDVFQNKDQRYQTIDVLRNSRKVFASKSLFDLTQDNPFSILVNTKKKSLEIVSTLPEEGIAEAFGGKIIITDIAHYQDLFQDYGYVDTLDIETKSGTNKGTVKEEIQHLMQGVGKLYSDEEKNEQAVKMTQAYQLNLNFLSCISLLVAFLLIYNIVSYNVLKRKKEMGILLCLGERPQTLFWLITMESILTGLIASGLGIGLGYLFSFTCIQWISQSFSTLYLPIEISEVHLSPSLIIKSLLLGPSVACMASLLPSIDIFKIPPRESFSYQNIETKFNSWIWPLTILSGVFLTLAVIFAKQELLNIHLLMGFVSPVLLVIGVCLLIPAFLSASILLCKKVLGKLIGLELHLAMDHIRMTLKRNAAAIAAMTIAIGMFIGVSMMILSFRNTVDNWIHHATKADIFVSTAYAIDGRKGGYIPEKIITYLQNHPGVEDYDWVSTQKIIQDNREIKLEGVRFEILKKHDRLLLKKKMSMDQFKDTLSEENICLVSEPYANRFNIKIGDQLFIPGNDEYLVGKVVNIFYDYSSDQGVILVPDTYFKRLTNQSQKQGMALYLKEGYSASVLSKEIQKTFSEEYLLVRNNQTLRNEVLKIFDDTFKITYSLQFIALIISGFTILNSVLMLMMERTREFGVMRAIGSSNLSLIKMITSESLFIGTTSLISGIGLGFCLAFLLIFVVNKFFFGWSVSFQIPWILLISTSIGATAISFLAGFFPGLFIARKIDGKVLHYE